MLWTTRTYRWATTKFLEAIHGMDGSIDMMGILHPGTRATPLEVVLRQAEEKV